MNPALLTARTSSPRELLTSNSSHPSPLPPQPEISIVVPTYNERDNIAELVERLDLVLAPLHWEVVFVDDDSPDGTAAVIEALSRKDARVRLLHRIGRRGLTSACVEGVQAAAAPLVAVMDADLQHDEAALPGMIATLTGQRLDIVVGTRMAAGGSMGEFQRHRIALSRMGRGLSRLACRTPLSDPMSGFFLVQRRFFLQCEPHMQGNGFKVLLDLLSSCPRPVRLGEVGYRFRTRQHGESKLDLSVGLEYLSLILCKLSRRASCPRRVQASLAALAVYLLALLLLRPTHEPFLDRQASASLAALASALLFHIRLGAPGPLQRSRAAAEADSASLPAAEPSLEVQG